MQKTIILTAACLLLSVSVFGQKYFTRSGHINFFSEAALENITADNEQVSSIIDFENGEIVFSLLMKSFEFENALMQEHFNEKYVHSDKFPKATFKGKIANISDIDLATDGTYKLTVSGDMTIHGETKPVETVGTLTIKAGTMLANATFDLTLADYGISIPSVVIDNIAEVVAITVRMDYQEYNK